jgi:hypothetical protein
MGANADDGDLNPENVERKLSEWVRRHWGRGATGPHPEYGGTNIMSAIAAADERFFYGDEAEFRDRPFAARPLRVRRVLTDGVLQDAAAFVQYLESATLYVPPKELDLGPTPPAWGNHGEWLEVWAVAILGEDADGGAKAAYQQYVEIRKQFPWVHPYFFQKVSAAAEIVEDFAVATVPQGA